MVFDFQRKHVAFVLSLFDIGVITARSLGRLGIPVIGLDSDPWMPGFKSRYCQAILSPHPVFEPDKLLHVLLTQGRKLNCPGVLFPTSDAYVIFISRHREQLKDYFSFILPPALTLELILDKYKQYELAKNKGMTCPDIFYPQTIDEVNDMKDKIRYPVFIKPCHGYIWSNHFLNKGFKVHNARELVEKLELFLAKGLQVMIQSIVVGPFRNNFEISAYISQKGHVLGACTVRKLRQYPLDLGTGTLVEAITFPQLLTMSLKFLSDIAYQGPANIEFKLDETDGKFKFIELNARLWLQVDLADKCGINFPFIQYLELTGQNPEPQLEFHPGAKWMDIILDCKSCWRQYRHGTLSVREWIRSLKKIKTFGVFSWDDPVPMLHTMKYGLKHFPFLAPLLERAKRH